MPEHEHDLDAAYIYPSDAEVTAVENGPDGLVLTALVPCPECEEAVEVTATVTEAADTDIEYPLEDVEDYYD